MDDMDTIINHLWGPNGAANKKEEQHYEEFAYEMSTNKKPVRYKTRQKQKPKGIKSITRKAILLIALSSSLVVGGSVLKNQAELSSAKWDIDKNLGSVVRENTNYFGYNENEQRQYWDYDIMDISSDILNKNQEYDIDTRIYGAYKSLNEYRKDEFMNELFQSLQSITQSNPDKFTEDVINACNHSSLNDYLESKGITLDEYQNIMDDILRAYAKDTLNEEEITELLQKLNGGAR